MRTITKWACGAWLALLLLSQVMLVYQHLSGDDRPTITGNHNVIIVITLSPDEEG